MKVEPIPTHRPTNADLAKGFNQLHDCHEDTKAKVEKIVSALGLDEGGKPTIATSTPRASFWRTVLAVIAGGSGLVFVVKVIVIVGPFMWGALLAAYHAIKAGTL